MRVRLSAMMFGQYFVMGAWVVTLATYLMTPPTRGGLNFPAGYASWVYATIAVGGIVSPLFTGLLADRLFAAQKLMGVFHVVGAALLGAAGYWCAEQQPLIEATYRRAAEAEMVGSLGVLAAEALLASPDGLPGFDQRDVAAARQQVHQALERVNQHPEVSASVGRAFGPLFVLMLLYSLCLLSTLTLSNVVGLRNLRQPERTFGRVRLFGTVGWVVAGVALGQLLNPISPGPLYLAAATSLLLGLFCFRLPPTPPKGTGGGLRESMGLPALKLLEHGPFLVLILCFLAMAVTQQFYAVYANLYLTDLRVPRPPAVQTLAQVAEVFALLLVPLVIARLGFRAVLTLGLALLALRNVAFATGSPFAVVVVGLPAAGFSYAFFHVVAAMYVDRLAPPHLRASAQGIITFVSLGLGTLAGNWLAAWVVGRHSLGASVDWAAVWMVPSAAAAAIAVAFVLLFRGADRPHRVSASSAP